MIKFNCDSCQKSVGVDDKYAGRLIKCPGCSNPTRIPQAAEPVVAQIVPDTPARAKTPVAQSVSPSCPNCRTQLFNPSDSMCGACGYMLQQSVSPPRSHPVQTPVAAQVQPTAHSSNTFAQPINRPHDHFNNPAAANPKSSTGRLFGAWMAAMFTGMVCAFFWGLIAPFFGIGGSALAWGIGGIFGLIAGLIGHNSGWKFCLATTLGALLCMLFGKLVSGCVVMAMIGASNMVAGIGDMFTPDNGVSMGVLEDLIDDGSLTDEEIPIAEKRAEGFFGNNDSDALDGFGEESEYEFYVSINGKIRERLDAMTPQERTAMLERSRERHPQWMEEPEMRTAIIHHMLINDLFEDPELKRYAEAKMLLANGEYDDYLDNAQGQSLDDNLSKRVNEKFASLDQQQREDIFRKAMLDNPQWTPRNHEHMAVMEKMHTEGTLPERLKETAAQKIRQEMDQDYSLVDYEEITDQEYAAQQKLASELTALVNTERSKINQQDLDSLVQQCKDKHPDWLTSDDPLEVFENLGDGIEDFQNQFESDGTFGSSLASRFKLNDIIWFALGLLSCFAIVFTFGKSSQ